MSDTQTLGTFRLEIKLGNDAMQTPEDVAEALHRVADRLYGGTRGGAFIMDANGNTVGSWEMLENPVPVEEEA